MVVVVGVNESESKRGEDGVASWIQGRATSVDGPVPLLPSSWRVGMARATRDASRKE